MRIAIDLDDVVIDLTTQWIKEYNEFTGDTAKWSDFNQWDFSRCVKYPISLYTFLEPPNRIYDRCEAVTGALDAIRALEREFDVIYLTAEFQPSKLTWLRKHDLVDAFEKMPSNLVIATNKSLIKADMLIDDKAVNVIKYPQGGLIFAKPWNNLEVLPNKVQRVEGWSEVLEYLGVRTWED